MTDNTQVVAEDFERFIKEQNKTGDLAKVLDNKNPEDALILIKDIIKYAKIDTISNVGSVDNLIENLENEVKLNKLKKSKSLFEFMEELKKLVIIDYDVDEIYNEFKTNNHHNLNQVPKSVIITNNYMTLDFTKIDDKFIGIRNDFIDKYPDKVKQIELTYNILKFEVREFAKTKLLSKGSMGVLGTVICGIFGYVNYSIFGNKEETNTNVNLSVAIGTGLFGFITSFGIYKSYKRISSDRIIDVYMKLIDLINELNK